MKGFVTGHFDVPHAGHFLFLTECLKIADEIYIGLNTDERIRHFKKREPIFFYQQRKNILSMFPGVAGVTMLKGVEFDVHFASTRQAIMDIKPDIVFTGWEHTADKWMRPLREEFGFIYCVLDVEVMHTQEFYDKIRSVEEV